VVHVCNSSYSEGGSRRIQEVKGSMGKVRESLFQKQNINKGLGMGHAGNLGFKET
jgi:hypothetical protein